MGHSVFVTFIQLLPASNYFILRTKLVQQHPRPLQLLHWLYEGYVCQEVCRSDKHVRIRNYVKGLDQAEQLRARQALLRRLPDYHGRVSRNHL